MPSFDIVSEIDWQEVKNAVTQANREVSNRYDFKGSDARVEAQDPLLTVYADDKSKVGQVVEILQLKLAKREVEIGALEKRAVTISPSGKAVQQIKVRCGIETELAKVIVKRIKSEKFKAQAAIQGEQIRISAKKRDDLQEIIAFLKAQEFGLPLQYTNLRD